MRVSDIDYNDDAYARSQNQERTVHQHGSIGYCPASAIGTAKTLVVVDNALYVDHEDLDVSWTYDVVDDDTDVL